MSFPSRLDIPEDVLEIAGTLEAAGHEAWCVGGAVRDTLLGEANTDYDIATSATPDVVQRLFKHTVPVGERFGTVAVRTRRRHHEVTTFRRDVSTDGRHAVVEFGVSLEDDLARRDFTINAIAHHPLRHEWRDPFNGAADLQRKLIRAVGEPETRFREDYLRILRGIRFAGRFGFAIDPPTWAAMLACADGFPRLSAERVREEWYKGLRTARSLSQMIELWRASGAARAWIPELLSDTPRHVTPDVSPTGSSLVQRHQYVGRLADRAAAMPAGVGESGGDLPRDPVLLTTLFCLDPVAVLVRLKAPNAEIARATAMVMGPPEPEGTSPVAVRRWMAAVGEAAEDMTALWWLRHGSAPNWEPVMRGIRERGEALSRKQLAISGTDLRTLGVPPGPQMGALLDRLLALVVDDPTLNSRETLLARARGMT
ncbi:MAG: CCA tRNA nucleotidyltransferase [Gemmatimonadota bacterium]|nr:CCA tRNA nucleotidyltransferase [Gemmatimonadota bacterium]